MSDRCAGFLKTHIGMDVQSVGFKVIERAARQRQEATACADEDAYWRLLNSSVEEQQALVEAVVVPETWFFRYTESFTAMARLAQQRLSSFTSERPLRILSLPCSTGEEPYSIAMALLDSGMAIERFQIDAVDISARVLELARVGCYQRNSFRGQQLEFRERYFSPAQQGFCLRESVRNKVRFIQGNLLDSRLLANEQPYDLVYCRNVLIYFDRPTQAQALTQLKRLLMADGFLFSGPAEATQISLHGMQPLALPHAFAFRKAQAKPLVVTAGKIALPPNKVAVPRAAAVVSRSLPPRSAAAPVRPAAPAAPAANDAVNELATIASMANSGRNQEALAAAERYLLQHGASAEVFYWLGLLSDVTGKADAALQFYRKALYLQPQHAETLAQMSALLTARGDLAGARRLQQRASRGVNLDG
jgi:chemotaxis protein methyltransferase WspC